MLHIVAKLYAVAQNGPGPQTYLLVTGAAIVLLVAGAAALVLVAEVTTTKSLAPVFCRSPLPCGLVTLL